MEINRCGICRRALRADDKGNQMVRTRQMGIDAIREYVKSVSPDAPEVELNGMYHSCKECLAIYKDAAEKTITDAPESFTVDGKLPDLNRKYALS